MSYEKLHGHLGHRIELVVYGDGEQIAVECEDCNAVLTSEDRHADSAKGGRMKLQATNLTALLAALRDVDAFFRANDDFTEGGQFPIPAFIVQMREAMNATEDGANATEDGAPPEK